MNESHVKSGMYEEYAQQLHDAILERSHYRNAYNEIVHRMEQIRQSIMLEKTQNYLTSDLGEDNLYYKSYIPSNSCEVDFNEEEEVSEEMLDFFRTTRKHQAERDAKKNKQTTQSNQKMKNENGFENNALNDIRTSRLVSNATSEAPLEQPDKQYKMELDHRYGKDSDDIEALETSIRAVFHADMDLYQPRFWPNMPLRGEGMD